MAGLNYSGNDVKQAVMSYRMVVVGVVIILIPHIILGIVEIKFAVFGFINGNFRL